MSPIDDRSIHVSVMPREVLHWMRIEPGLIVMDGTLGAGGHSRLILKALKNSGRLIGLSRMTQVGL